MNTATRTAQNNIENNGTTFPWLSTDFNRQPNPVYLYLDLRDGEITVDTGTRGSCSSDEFNKLIFSFELNAYTTFDLINDFVNANLNDFQKILDITFCYWDNSNYRGQLIGDNNWIDAVQTAIEMPFVEYHSIADDNDLIEDYENSGSNITPVEFAQAVEDAKGPDYIICDSYDSERVINVINEHIIQNAKDESYGIESNTFAEACVNQNSLEELITAICGEADETDMKTWNIDADEWQSQIKEAIAALSE